MNKLLHRFCRLSLLLICILCSSSLFATEVSVTIGDYATTNGWANGTKYESVTLDANVTATVSATDANSGKYYTSGNQWRLYQTGNATLTIATSSGTLSSVKVTYASQNTGVLKNGTETVASDAVLSVTGSSITLSVGNSGSATNGQARVTAITVVYEADGGGSLTCATPTFDPAAGTYTSAQSVTISTTTPGATIYYTTDGNDPVVSGNVYSGPITVSTSQTIKAIASAAGYESSSIATAVYNIVNLEHAGTEADPYTVADALIAIDAGVGTTDVYVKGIVSGIKTAYSSAYGNISYNISDDGSDTSDQLLAFRGKSFNGDNFTSENDVLVGDEVVVNGNLIKYGSTYELAKDNKLVSLNRPSSTVVAPTLTPSATSAETGENVTITVSQPDFDGDAASIYYTTDGSDPTSSATRAELADSGENQIVVTMGTADIVVNAVAQKYGSTDYSSVASVTITYFSNDAKTLPYEVDLLSSTTGQSDFTFEQTSPAIWSWTSNYGAKGTAGSKVDAEGWLISPVISLVGATAPSVTWEEVLRYFGTVENEATVWVREGTTGSWNELTVATRDDNGSNWTYTSVGDNDLSSYIGKDIQIGFKYVSTTDAYGTWEIKNFSVTEKTTPAVDTPVLTPSATSAEAGSDVTITVSQTDFDGDAGEIWYTTDGTDPKTSSTKQVLDDSTINTITVTMADADIVVKAVATTDGGTTFSDEASVTISLIKVYTIKSINEACDPSVTTSTDIATHVRLQFTDAVVVDKIPGSSNNNLYIREGSWAICLFAHTSEQIVGTTLQVGDKLNGWIEGTVCNYRGIPEFKTTSATTIDNLTVEGGQTVRPSVYGTDYSYIENFNNRADLISMEGTITKDGTRYYLDTDGIQLYEPGVFATNLLGALENDADWTTYTFRVTGPVAAIYGGKPEIYVRKVEIKLDTTEDSHENVSRMSMYYGNYNLVPAEGQWIETYNVNSGSKTLTCNAWYNHTGETAAIAKGTGFLTWTSASQTYWQIVEDSYTNFHEADANNILTGTDYIQGITTDPNYYYFVLSYYDSTDKEGTLGFYFPAGTGETQLAGGTSVFENGAHKAYAVVPVADVPAGVAGFSFNDGAVTGIDGINADTQNSADGAVYTLSGVRVQNTQSLPKGIYVKNGKKVVVK